MFEAIGRITDSLADIAVTTADGLNKTNKPLWEALADNSKTVALKAKKGLHEEWDKLGLDVKTVRQAEKDIDSVLFG